MHGGGFVNATRGGILYLQSMSLTTRIDSVVAVYVYAEMILRIEVHHEGRGRSPIWYGDVAVNLLRRNGTVGIWLTHDADGKGDWDNTESHIWVAL